MKPEDIQHGGNHYKDQPKHLQPIYLATALKLNPMEYSVLKYLLRHRKKGGLLDLQKMMHFGQMLLQEEYGVEAEIKYLGEPIDAEFEVTPESQPVTSGNPQESPACPFKVGDVVQSRDAESKTKWKITHIKDGKLLVTSHDPYQTPSWIERVFWNNYRVIKQGEVDASQEPQPCPFKAGDVIQSIRWSDYIFRVYEIRGDTMEADSVTSGHRYKIPRDHWDGYRLKSDFGVDKPAATC
jgi:hypothetical protein